VAVYVVGMPGTTLRWYATGDATRVLL
jgi:hypothetical protein